MKIRFWGVRGSIASPGPHTATVGGNTSCVEVRCGDRTVVFDAGTGLRALGEHLMGVGAGDVSLFLSHLHWDHIQGLPFFLPAYVPGNRIAIVGAQPAEMSLEQALAEQMRAPLFPVRLSDLSADLGYRHIRAGEQVHVGEATVHARKLNHPGGVMGYRVDCGGRSVVYATDTEHYSCVDPTLRDLSEGADVLIYDAQYTSAEYRGDVGRSKVGWGHSTWEAAVELARAASVGHLVLFHHDPQRTDAQVAEIESLARAQFQSTSAAREGTCIDLPGTVSGSHGIEAA